jgi:hypothetical protein
MRYKVWHFKVPLLGGGRPLRNCPVGNFREEPDSRVGYVVGQGWVLIRQWIRDKKIASPHRLTGIAMTVKKNPILERS